jgi:RNA polymerase sigma-70 factor (ECF subfamily)
MTVHPEPPHDASREEPLTAEATVDLLEMIRQGDDDALDTLLRRCMPALRRWAHGRLPPSARGMQETADLVQDAVLAAVKKLDGFEARHQGALQAYLRQAVMNRIRDIIRQRDRRPNQVELPEQLSDRGASPLEQAIGAQNTARYERALQRLAAADREAIIGRLEMQYSYDELAVVLDKPTAAAARMTVTRAMKRLALEMKQT